MLPDPKTTLGHATKKAWTLLDEFKAFAFKGNVVDLAIGVIIGGAFQKIIDSLVKNLFMPLLAVVLPGQQGYTGWKVTLRGSTIHFGLFLGDVVQFLLMAAVLFVFIRKFLGWLMRAKETEKPAPPLTPDQQLLTEIRDLLKAQAPGPPPAPAPR
jgi:large conductance mechanosensitive channel